MKAIVLKEVGSLDNLRLVNDRRMPVPKENELCVKVAAVGLNPVDYKLAQGWGGVKWDKAPVLGLDVAGTIHAIGRDVKKFAVGELVYYHGDLSKSDGGYGEYACTTAHTVSRLPEGISFVQAAALPCSGFTAYQAVVKKLKPEEGKTILIHGGAGGVGGYSIQLAKGFGLEIMTTCSPKNTKYVKSLGAIYAIDYSKEDVFQEVMKITKGRGVDYIINTVNSESATRDVDMLAFGGQLVAVVEHPDFQRIRFYEKGLSIHEVALGGAHINGDYVAQEELSHIGDQFAMGFVRGELKPLAITEIKLEEIPQCLKELEKRHVTGKMVAKLY